MHPWDLVGAFILFHIFFLKYLFSHLVSGLRRYRYVVQSYDRSKCGQLGTWAQSVRFFLFLEDSSTPGIHVYDRRLSWIPLGIGSTTRKWPIGVGGWSNSSAGKRPRVQFPQFPPVHARGSSRICISVPIYVHICKYRNVCIFPIILPRPTLPRAQTISYPLPPPHPKLCPIHTQESHMWGVGCICPMPRNKNRAI